jgi:hypothetical protein
MIPDPKKWNLGLSLLGGFMQHLPASFDEDHVKQFNKIILTLEEASGEDFSHFKVPDEKLARIAKSSRPGGYGGGRGSVTFSKKKFCDSDYFRSQVRSLSNYIATMAAEPSAKVHPYEFLTDEELVEKLSHRKEVVPTNSTIINMHRSNLNFQSPGASIMQGNDFKSDDFQKLIGSVKEFAATEVFPEEHRHQINIDIGVVELQIGSQRPSSSIIRESLQSVRRILENAAGSIVATGILHHLQRYLS